MFSWTGSKASAARRGRSLVMNKLTVLWRALFLAAVGGFFVSIHAHAAGFSCARATIKVEHLICDDKALSALDSDMSYRYLTLLETAASPSELIKVQRAWLMQRNRCADADCLTKAYHERIASMEKTPLAGWKRYHDPRLKISFEYLGNREVKPCSEDSGNNCLMLVGHNMANSNYLIEFQVTEGSLEEVAEKEAGFVREGNKWVTSFGRFNPVEVTRMKGKGWKGMEAVITCGISDPETGFHAAGGSCWWVVISNGKRAVVADTQGIVGLDPFTMRTIQSFQFTP